MAISKIIHKKTLLEFSHKIKSLINTKPVLAYSIISLTGCLFLNIGIFKNYAFLDANEHIWTASRSINFQNEFREGGRFLLGIIYEFVYGSLCTTIADLKWVRLVSLLGCVLFSVQIFSFLLKLKMKVYESALFSFLILTIPSFSVYYGWSSTSEIPILLNINFLAGLLLIKALDENKNLYYFTSLALVITSLCIYQSAVTVFLLPFVFSCVLIKNFSIKKVFSILIFIGISFGIYYFVFKFSLYWYHIEPSNRTQLNLFKVPLKVVVFYLREMRMLVQSSGLLIWSILFLTIGAFSILGFFYSIYQKRTKTPQFFFFISWLALVLPLTYLPNLLSSQNYVCSRAMAPAAILTLFYQFYFLRQLSIKYKILKKISLSLATVLIILSSVNLNFYIAKVQSKEYNAIKTVFNKIPLDNTKRIIIIKPKHGFLQEFKFYKQGSADEFANVSSTKSWAPAPLFNQLLKERMDSLKLEKKEHPQNKIEVYELEDEFHNENSIVINLIDVLKNEFSKK